MRAIRRVIGVEMRQLLGIATYFALGLMITGIAVEVVRMMSLAHP